MAMNKTLLYLKAFHYCEGVVNGTYCSNKYVKKTCQNFIDDINEIKNNPNSKYVLHMGVLSKIESLLEIIYFVDGDGVKGKRIIDGISGFQCLILVAFFGFRFRDNPNKRRYNQVVLLIGRKNGKTFLTGLINLILMMIEPKWSQFYSISTKSDKAKIIANEMQKIIDGSPLKSHFKTWKSGFLMCKNNNNLYKPLSKNVGDGDKPTCFIADEVGAFETTDGIEAMRGGQIGIEHGNKSEFLISTAYEKENLIWNDIVENCKKILDGKITEKENIFSLLYYADIEEVDKFSDEAIYQANPICYDAPSIFGKKVSDRKDAIEGLMSLDYYLVKHLNLFLNNGGEGAYLQPKWLKPSYIDDYDFTGKKVVIGVDLACKNDNNGISILHQEDNGNIIVKSVAFIPKSMVNEKTKLEKIDYQGAIDRKECFASGEEQVDHNDIISYIVELSKTMKIEKICYDDAYSGVVVQGLKNKTNMIPIYQGNNLNNPVRIFREMLIDKKVKIIYSKLFERDLLNTMVIENEEEKLKIGKKTSRKHNGRVDQTVATINAMKWLVELKQLNQSRIRIIGGK